MAVPPGTEAGARVPVGASLRRAESSSSRADSKSVSLVFSASTSTICDARAAPLRSSRSKDAARSTSVASCTHQLLLRVTRCLQQCRICLCPPSRTVLAHLRVYVCVQPAARLCSERLVLRAALVQRKLELGDAINMLLAPAKQLAVAAFQHRRERRALRRVG